MISSNISLSAVGSCVGFDKGVEVGLLDLDGSCEMLGTDEGFIDVFLEGIDDGPAENNDDVAVDVEGDVEGDVVEQLFPNGTDEYFV